MFLSDICIGVHNFGDPPIHFPVTYPAEMTLIFSVINFFEQFFFLKHMYSVLILH